MKNIVIFASGGGSNAENIIKFFKNHQNIRVALVVSNSSKAKVLERARRQSVPTIIFNKTDLQTGKVLQVLKKRKINFVVLAGFLLKIPTGIINEYNNKIINIHPSLLPKYGGRGMYGIKVHEKVKISGDTKTGITIHFVNQNYDEGKVIFQAQCFIKKNTTVKTIEKKVRNLEMQFFPYIIERVLNDKY